MMSALLRGWASHEKQRLPAFFVGGDDLSTTPERPLSPNDRVAIIQTVV